LAHKFGQHFSRGTGDHLGKVNLKSGSLVRPGQEASVGVPIIRKILKI